MNRDEISERLAHFFVFFANRHESVVHPIVDELLPRLCFALGNLVFVVRKFQILAAGMNIYRFAQILRCHDRAFDVPTGPSVPKRRFPMDFTWFCGFP